MSYQSGDLQCSIHGSAARIGWPGDGQAHLARHVRPDAAKRIFDRAGRTIAEHGIVPRIQPVLSFQRAGPVHRRPGGLEFGPQRPEEHTSELPSLMSISYT